jgi:hypothetical protein
MHLAATAAAPALMGATLVGDDAAVGRPKPPHRQLLPAVANPDQPLPVPDWSSGRVLLWLGSCVGAAPGAGAVRARFSDVSGSSVSIDGSTDMVSTAGRIGGLMSRTARSLRRTAMLAGAGVAASIAVMAAAAASASTLSLGSVAAGPRVVVGGMSTDQIRTSVAPRSVRPMSICPSGCSV